MSLALTALRLQVVATLLADPDIAGCCGPRVYDSRISDFDIREPVPVIVVTTEEMTGEAYSRNNGGPPFNLRCDLVLEIAVYDAGTATIAGQVVDGVGPAETDAELEGDVDFLAHYAPIALGAGETPEAQLLRTAVTRRIGKVKSSRFVSDDVGVKWATRLLTLEVELKGDEGDDPDNPPTGPFARLPEPLRSVAQAAVPGSGAAFTCLRLAGRRRPLDPGEAPPAFAGIGMTVAPQSLSSAATPDQAADEAAGRTFAIHADP